VSAAQNPQIATFKGASGSISGIQAGSSGCSARVTAQRGGPARLCDSRLAGRLVLCAGEVAGLVLDNLDWRGGRDRRARQAPAVRAAAAAGRRRRAIAAYLQPGTAGERAAARIDNYLGFPAGISGAELEVRIPKLRQGSYFRSFLEPRRRSGRALWRSSSRPTSAGPTRRVDQLVESLGLRVSRSGAVRICARHAIGAASTQDWKRRWSI
jgi:hypothetical protein